MNKTLLLASFVLRTNLEWFIGHLKKNFNISSEKLFFFNIGDDPTKVVVTFKIVVEVGERLDIRKHFKNTIPIHKKGSSLYTINALNKLIESECDQEVGNINHKNYKIDWDKYQDTFILKNGENLVLMPITRAFY